ncbi:MAG: glycogen synthase, partial [Chlamydiae bacterium]|nr:glycogen synthase [Chlamydiota bacterium]
MHIVHVCSELAPIAKVGGLADVVYGLSKELIRLGHTVHILLPKYDCIDYSKLQNLQVFYRDLWSYEGPYRYHNTVWSAQVENLLLFLLEPHHPSYFFSRGVLYGCADDIDRFLYFSRAAMEFIYKANLQPDVLHLHDWPTAILPLLQKDMYLSLGHKRCKTVLTLHNLEYQGHCLPKNLSQTGLKGEHYLSPHALQDPVNPHLLNLLKGGILYADVLTTVSPS